MQKFYTDKTKLFECNIEVDGADLSETKARLILEFPNNRNLLFHGKVDKYGKCEVKIPALKEINEAEGKVILEVIADSTYFESWNDKFKLTASKKVMVEVFSNDDKDVINEEIEKPKVRIITENDESLEEKINEIIGEDQTLEKFKKYINENQINIKLTIKSKTKLINVLQEYKKYTNSSKDDVMHIAEELKNAAKSGDINKLLVS